jgi:hypothetical protein
LYLHNCDYKVFGMLEMRYMEKKQEEKIMIHIFEGHRAKNTEIKLYSLS